MRVDAAAHDTVRQYALKNLSDGRYLALESKDAAGETVWTADVERAMLYRHLDDMPTVHNSVVVPILVITKREEV